jgi:hypothetical protein
VQECVEALLVHLAAVCNASDRDELRRVVDDVRHAPVPDSDAPLVLVAFQLFASCGPGLSASARIFRSVPANSASSSASNSFLRRLLDFERVLNHAGGCASGGAVLLVRYAFFLPARFRHKSVPEVLPDGPVFFQVDRNTGLSAFLIGDKLDSALGFIVLHVRASPHCPCAPCPRNRHADPVFKGHF